MNQNGVEIEAEECAILRPLDSSSGQTVDVMVASGMEDVGACRSGHGTTMIGLQSFYYRKVFRGDEMLSCSLLKELELTATKF